MKNELHKERFHGNGLKNLNSAVILKITPPKKKFGARGWHKESFLKFELNRTRNPLFKIKVWGKISECTVHFTGLEKSFLCQSQNFSDRARAPFFWSDFLSSWSQSCAQTQKFRCKNHCLGPDSKANNGGAVANQLRRRTSDQTVLGTNPAVAAALSPWTSRQYYPSMRAGPPNPGPSRAAARAGMRAVMPEYEVFVLSFPHATSSSTKIPVCVLFCLTFFFALPKAGSSFSCWRCCSLLCPWRFFDLNMNKVAIVI